MAYNPFSGDMTITEAKAILRELADDGHACPVCTQHVKVYKRKVNSSMARDLIAIYRTYGTDFAYLPDVRKTTGSKGNREESKLRYWGLIEEDNRRREDGGRAGFWRITPRGVDWVLGRSTIPKYARVFDARLLSHEGEQVSIRDALGTKFRYDELMAGV